MDMDTFMDLAALGLRTRTEPSEFWVLLKTSQQSNDQRGSSHPALNPDLWMNPDLPSQPNS